MIDLNKYVHRGRTTKDIVHTSGYAKVAASGTFGSSSRESFSERRAVDQNRKIVRGYRNSRILGESSPVRYNSQVAVTPEIADSPAKPAPPPPTARAKSVALPPK